MYEVMGIVLGILGLVTGYVFYRKGLRIKQPMVAYKTNDIIRGYGSKFDDLEILYKHERVENLSVTKIVFWNEGAETIDKLDLQTIDPLRIIAKFEELILDVKTLSNNNSASQFSCSLSDDKRSAEITFDYVDKRQGCVNESSPQQAAGYPADYLDFSQ